MKLRLLVLLFSLVSSTVAWAQDSADEQSELLRQAPGGALELSPSIGVSSTRFEIKNTNIEGNSSSLPVGLEVEYGFNDFFSLGADVGYSMSSMRWENCGAPYICESSKSKGMVDPSLAAKLRLPVGEGAIRLNLNYSFSLEDSKTESDGDSNNASGGSTLTAGLGYEHRIGPNIFGGIISMEVYQSERTHKDEEPPTTGTEKIEGGETMALGAFYQRRLPSNHAFGVAVAYTITDETKSKSAGVTTDNNNKFEALALHGYMQLRMNDRLTLIPSLMVGTVDMPSRSDAEDVTATNITGTARFTF